MADGDHLCEELRNATAQLERAADLGQLAVPNEATAGRMEHDLAAPGVERSPIDLLHEKATFGGVQELLRIGTTRQQFEMVRSRQGCLMAAATKAGTGDQDLGARRVIRIRDRLVDSAVADQPAAHDRLTFVVGRPIDAGRRPSRIVEHVEPGRTELGIGPISRDSRPARRAVDCEKIGLERMAHRFVQHHGRRTRREEDWVPAGQRRRGLARPEAPDQSARHTFGIFGLEVRREPAEATPGHLHIHAIEDLAFRGRHKARPHHLQVAPMPTHGQTERKGDVVPPDGALERAREGAQRRHRDSRRRTDRELRFNQRRGVRTGDLPQGVEESGAGDLVATGEPGVIAAHQTHRQALLLPHAQATSRLGRRPLGIDAALEVDLGQVPRLRGDRRKCPRHRRCLEFCPGHAAAIVPQRRKALPTLECIGKSAMSAAPTQDETLVETLMTTLARRTRSDGAAVARPDESEPSVEATVWLALALRVVGGAAGNEPRAMGRAVTRMQSADGRVSISPLHPGAYSPTSVAILAWQGQPEFDASRRRALGFLLAHSGEHFPRDPSSPIAMDTSLAGWPWIDRTFSWAEPTALALLALESAGEGDHPRAREGRALLLDRQIASGGWNYGNAEVFGSELRPAPESTGLVLSALAGRTSATAVASSLAYLERVEPRLRTPLALGWASLARSAWRIGLDAPDSPGSQGMAIRETLARESRYGAYETADLALLAIAASSPRGLLAALTESA